MNQRVIWKKYITAQSKILEHKSKPIGIDTNNSGQINGLELEVSVDQEIFKQKFKKEIELIFKIKDFDFKDSYVLTDLEIAETDKFKSALTGLKELAEKCYISFNDQPVIEGFFKPINDLRYIAEFIKKETGIEIPLRRFIEEKSVYLTATERSAISKLKDITFKPEIKAKFSLEATNRNANIFNLMSLLYKQLDSSKFKTSRRICTVSFMFKNEVEFEEKIKILREIDYVRVVDRGQDQKFKYQIQYDNCIDVLQKTLKQNKQNLITKIVNHGEKLIFRVFYKTGQKSEICSQLKNDLDSLLKNLPIFSYQINEAFQEKYLCEENFKLKVEQEEEKLSKLKRTEYFVCDEEEKKIFDIGTLLRVEYPNLTFTLKTEDVEIVNQRKNEIIAIKPDLKGERDKIERLLDTVNKLDSNQKLPNDNAKVFLYDSSKAKIISNIDYLLNKTSEEWQDFEEGIFPLNKGKLNDSQKQAILKTLYAQELALIQGPPGTGKSTAIAEIIWQHIRVAQKEKKKTKILLTSETNLAVDNAIDRLKNNQNNIVKPIRFGNTENLESEGYFYSLEAIKNWEKSNATQNNTVSHWVANIVNRITQQEDEQINSALNNWKIYLQNPNSETKKLFADKYLEYVNLIGATGSSIGKLNSEDNWTSFFRSYLNVFEYSNYETFLEKSQQIKDFKSDDNVFQEELRKIKWEFSTLKTNLEKIDISFDTIIMDEASKATPPELALPVLFGKKSIIVGDHRQLPPMIDGEEIKDILISIGEKELAETLSKKEFETSQFERLFKNIDESLKGTFDTQYRMHPAINDVIAQFYTEDSEKGLLCGLPPDEAYHNSFVKWDSRYHGLKYEKLITPETHTIWINVNTPEIQEGTSRVNYGEIEAIDNVLSIIKNCEGKSEFDNWLSNQSQEEKQIGLISFYGKQISYLERMLLQSHNDLYKGKGKDNDKRNLVRLSTVDRFQGMERNIIIVSMVRSNKIAGFQDQQPDYNLYPVLGYTAQESLGFAESPNRLNVALSRARRLLIVVGNSEHFCRKPIYKNVFDTIQQNGKIISAVELQNVIEQNG